MRTRCIVSRGQRTSSIKDRRCYRRARSDDIKEIEYARAIRSKYKSEGIFDETEREREHKVAKNSARQREGHHRLAESAGLRGTGVRVHGDILPVIKKRLVGTSRGCASFARRGKPWYAPIFLYYNIVPARRSFVRNKTLPRSSADGREAFPSPLSLYTWPNRDRAAGGAHR